MAFTIQTSDLERVVSYLKRHDAATIVVREFTSGIEIRTVNDPSRTLLIRPKDSTAPDKVEVTEQKFLGDL